MGGETAQGTNGILGSIAFVVILIIICWIVSKLRQYEHITLMIIVEFVLSPTAIFRYIIGGLLSVVLDWNFSLEMLGGGVGYALNFLFYAYPDKRSSYNSNRKSYNDSDYSSSNSNYSSSQTLPDGYINDIGSQMYDIANYNSGCINASYGVNASIDYGVSKNRIIFNISVTFEINDLDGFNKNERQIFSYAKSDANELARKVKAKALNKIENLNHEYGVNKKYDIVVNINVSKR